MQAADATSSAAPHCGSAVGPSTARDKTSSGPVGLLTSASATAASARARTAGSCSDYDRARGKAELYRIALAAAISAFARALARHVHAAGGPTAWAGAF